MRIVTFYGGSEDPCLLQESITRRTWCFAKEFCVFVPMLYLTMGGRPLRLRPSTFECFRPLLVICHPVHIAYLCTKFDDFRFSCSSDDWSTRNF